MECKICGKEIKGKVKILEQGKKAHVECHVLLQSTINAKPGPELKTYEPKLTAEPRESAIEKHIIGSIDDDYMKRAMEEEDHKGVSPYDEDNEEETDFQDMP